MRMKSLVSRARVRMRPRISPESDPDENNREFRSNLHYEPGENNQDVENGSGDDGLCHKKHCNLMGNNEAGENVDLSLNKDASCIACDQEDGRVLLVCCGTDCPVVLHQECMNVEPDFDKAGNFYCPYCWFKRQVLRSRMLREKAVMAQKALAAEKEKTMEVDIAVEMEKSSREADDVVDVNPSDGRKRSHSECEAKGANGELHDQQMQLEKDRQRERNVAEMHGVEVPGDGERIRSKRSKEVKRCIREGTANNQLQEVMDRNDMDRFETCKDGERIQVDHQREADDFMHGRVSGNHQGEPQNGFCKGKRKSADGSLPATIRETRNAGKGNGENENSLEEDEEMKPSALQIVSSPIYTNGNGRCEPDAHQLALVVCPRQVVKKTITKGQPIHYVGPSKRVIPSEMPAMRRNFVFGNGKRKRLFWTPEEEDMLRVGVEKFSAIANKNIPWRKILEFGQHVFHEERTPVDLKDKWKNMMNRGH